MKAKVKTSVKPSVRAVKTVDNKTKQADSVKPVIANPVKEEVKKVVSKKPTVKVPKIVEAKKECAGKCRPIIAALPDISNIHIATPPKFEEKKCDEGLMIYAANLKQTILDSVYKSRPYSKENIKNAILDSNPNAIVNFHSKGSNVEISINNNDNVTSFLVPCTLIHGH